MRVLVVGMSSNSGGIESIVMNYVRHVWSDRLNFDFLVDVAEKIAYEDEINQIGGRIYRVSSRRDNPIKHYRDIHTFFNRYGKNYVALWQNSLVLSDMAYLSQAKKVNIPVRIIHCHNSNNQSGWISSLFHKYNRRRVSFFATDYWSCSNYAASWFFTKKNRLSPRFRIIHNAIDSKTYNYNDESRTILRSKLGIENCKVIGHVGRFEEQKNHLKLVKIFAALYAKDNSYRLMLVGTGKLLQEVRASIEKFGLTNVVHIITDSEDVASLYNVFDLILFPSLYEGLPVVLIEAQMNGLPCVYSSSITPEVEVADNLLSFSNAKTAEEWATFIFLHEKKLCRNMQLDVTKMSDYIIDIQASDMANFFLEKGRNVEKN
jgi:glycosyltransferase involved in cell wall biosynthesis